METKTISRAEYDLEKRIHPRRGTFLNERFEDFVISESARLLSVIVSKSTQIPMSWYDSYSNSFKLYVRPQTTFIITISNSYVADDNSYGRENNFCCCSQRTLGKDQSIFKHRSPDKLYVSFLIGAPCCESIRNEAVYQILKSVFVYYRYFRYYW